MNPTSSHSQEDLSIVDSLAQLSFLVHGILGRVGAEADLSIIQIRLLGILRDREPSMQQLAQHLALDKSSITGLIDRAAKRGLVERIPSPTDKRGFLVRVTDAGRKLIDGGGDEIIRQLNAAVTAAGLSNAEQAQFAALATRIIGANNTL
ncbi:MarR family winged helix-turn-helix transcriptional regulator [Paenibacillus sp. OV219]|uniref:MarR family winged helix-turn-helix transcriptional regulator n=1 Tax=Paenibacillus sp. OV219 TaxID=1884377 RepID=UPI0008BEC49E|nr:MarR family transcriptional regulator [Paenibacillus sp. OV219]SEN51180.1 DNA-binding transcriptional regulator, MarR family [Paenibacillus sp. OV219]